MPRELRRLLIDPARLVKVGEEAGERAPALAFTPPEAHYVGRVLRLRPGDRLAVIDGRGQLWSGVLLPEDQLELEQPVQHPLQQAPPPALALELAMAVPKREADLVWRMATELGADRLQPLLAQRSVVRGGLPLQRWQAIVREATEQCERLWQPRLQPCALALEWLSRPPAGWGLIATTRRQGLPELGQVLAPLDLAEPTAATAVSLAIGPEGGWTEEEEGAATAAGWQAVSLGEPILRSSTAAVAGLARLCGWRSLSCRSFPWPCP